MAWQPMDLAKSEEGIYLHLVEALIKWCLSMWKIKSNVHCDLKPSTWVTCSRWTSTRSWSDEDPQHCMIKVAIKSKLKKSSNWWFKSFYLYLSWVLQHLRGMHHWSLRQAIIVLKLSYVRKTWEKERVRENSKILACQPNQVRPGWHVGQTESRSGQDSS